MAGQAVELTIGIEEEYQLIDPQTRELAQRSPQVLGQAEQRLGEAVQPELYRSQIEIASPVCASLAELRTTLAELRRGVIAAAAAAGYQIAAAGTHPFSHWEQQQITPKERYRGIADEYRHIAGELIIFGCHVHVGLGDPEGRIDVLNRARVWLPPLLALAANSPFWLGHDTGYASFRTELWSRFPTAGPPHTFASRAEYDALVRTLVDTGSIQDATKIYWDIRLPEQVPTIEFRVTDVCQSIDEAIMIAGLVRALVGSCYAQAQRGEPLPAARPELLRAAHWRAARYGLESELIDVAAATAVPARTAVEALLAFVRPSLEAAGDWDEIAALVQRTLQHGNGAQRQREVYRRSGRLEAVVDAIVAETAPPKEHNGRDEG